MLVLLINVPEHAQMSINARITSSSSYKSFHTFLPQHPTAYFHEGVRLHAVLPNESWTERDVICQPDSSSPVFQYLNKSQRSAFTYEATAARLTNFFWIL